jgi:hypothetical protein
MGLDFLKQHGGRRSGAYSAAPSLFLSQQNPEEEGDDTADTTGTHVNLDYETEGNPWATQDIEEDNDTDSNNPEDFGSWQWTPRRFVDGKDVGRTAAWLESPDGWPIPVRVAQIGAATLYSCNDEGTNGEPWRLDCETRLVEKVVALEADQFPWDEVESFAAALHANGFRLLIARRGEGITPFEFDALQNTAKKRSNEEMFRLERQAIRGCRETPAAYSAAPLIPTLADGRLEDKRGGFAQTDPVYGVIKKHNNLRYLNAESGLVFYRLCPGERTPAFSVVRPQFSIVTWYLRLDSLSVSGPTEGVVRVELTKTFFEDVIRGDFGFVNRLSRFILRCRTRDSGYQRAAVTVLPIQQTEEKLRAHFAPAELITNDFYHLTGI